MCYLTGWAVNTDADEAMGKFLKNVRYDTSCNHFDAYATSFYINDADMLPSERMTHDIEKGIV